MHGQGHRTRSTATPTPSSTVIAEELHPVRARELSRARPPAGLFGNSYGGLFSSYALFSRCPLFDRYIIGSPGNVFPEDFVLDLEQRCWDAGPTLNASAYLTCGSLERTSYSEGVRYIAIAYDKLCARLAGRDYEGFTLTSREYEGESHVSVGLPTLIDGIKLLYPGDPSTAPRFRRVVTPGRQLQGKTHHEHPGTRAEHAEERRQRRAEAAVMGGNSWRGDHGPIR